MSYIRFGAAFTLCAFLAFGQNIDSSRVRYTNPASGATTRTAASKFADTVSVKDFGAKGDGTTDDSAAFQAAVNSIASSGYGTIYCPNTAASYRLNSNVVTNGRNPLFVLAWGCSITGTGTLPTTTVKYDISGNLVLPLALIAPSIEAPAANVILLKNSSGTEIGEWLGSARGIQLGTPGSDHLIQLYHLANANLTLFDATDSKTIALFADSGVSILEPLSISAGSGGTLVNSLLFGGDGEIDGQNGGYLNIRAGLQISGGAVIYNVGNGSSVTSLNQENGSLNFYTGTSNGFGGTASLSNVWSVSKAGVVSSTGLTSSGPISGTTGTFTGQVFVNSASGIKFNDGSIQTAAGVQISTSSVSGNTSVSSAGAKNQTFFASGNITVTLYAASAVPGGIITVKKTDTNANTVTINTAGGTMDGQSSVTLVRQYDSYTFISDGTNWFLI